jgi:hypothetical protein
MKRTLAALGGVMMVVLLATGCATIGGAAPGNVSTSGGAAGTAAAPTIPLNINGPGQGA